jgi:hypothetical protein
MAIPVVNEVPKYSTIIPSTKAKATFRPFLVKEQKVLLMALESQNEEDMLEAIVDTIETCFEGVQPRTLTTFDIEYLFTKLRSKSVGETATVGIECDKCSGTTEVDIKLDSIEVVGIKDPPEITLNEKFTLKLRYPSYSKIRENTIGTKMEGISNLLFHLAVSSLDKLLTEEEAINLDEEPLEERIKFLDNLKADQFKQIMDFIEDMPQLFHNIEFNCESCGEHNKQHLIGTESFFV